jgi:hypothetical protein
MTFRSFGGKVGAYFEGVGAVDLGCGVDVHAAALKQPPRRSPAREGLEVIEERRRNYGPPIQNFDRIAALWQVALGPLLQPGAIVTKAHVAQLMRLVKEARLVETPDHWDSLVDIVGYVECHADVLPGQSLPSS